MGSQNIGDYLASLSSEERIENARRAGVASGEARRRRRSHREALQELLRLDVDDPAKADALVKLGLDPTFLNAIGLATIGKAADGDVEAARFVRDTVGEKPTEQYNLGLSSKPIKSLDLSQLTDEELESLADQSDD